MEEGASGFLGKKVVGGESSEAVSDSTHVDWDSFSKMFSDRSAVEDISFGSKNWASVYLASTPQQAAELGLKFPGVDEVKCFGAVLLSYVTPEFYSKTDWPIVFLHLLLNLNKVLSFLSTPLVR